MSSSRVLPAVAGARSSPGLASLAPARAPSSRAGERPRDAELTLAGVLWSVWSARWTVAAVAAVTLAVAGAYLFLTPPVYEANALVQVVEDKERTPLGLKDLSDLFPDASQAEAETEVIRSRALLGAVVAQLGLDVDAAPRHFPLVGAAVARLRGGVAPATPVPGLSRFAWGGEAIEVGQLEVDEALLELPLTLTALGAGRYRVTSGSTDLVEGVVGSPAASAGRPLLRRLLVTKLTARPGTEFVLERHRPAQAIEALQRVLHVTEKTKKAGMLVLELTGSDPARIASTLIAITATYIRQSVERNSAEAARTLEFLDQQLPVLKTSMERAEVALEEYRRKKGRVDLPLETQRLLERTADVEKALSEVELQRSEQRQRFTPDHPMVAIADRKTALLRAELDRLHAEMRTLPAAESESARLVRDVKVATDLYVELLNKAQELRVVRSATLGNVRLIDPALVPFRPVRPRPGPVLVVALLFGLGAGVAVALGRHAAKSGSEDPREIQARTGLSVYGAIPRSSAERRLRRGTRSDGGGRGALAAAAPDDPAVEGFRSLRTAVLFALLGARNNIVVVSGPGPGVGKSFVAVNLAHVLASEDRRVLLVDADLRRGEAHRYFGPVRQPGVAEVLLGEAEAKAAIQATGTPHLWFLPAGRLPPNPSELATSRRFERLLAEASAQFGVVIVDTPPLLAVADAIPAARLAAVNLLVLRYGHHPASEVNQMLGLLEQNGVHVHGAVLNDVRERRGRYGRYGHYYRYDSRSRR